MKLRLSVTSVGLLSLALSLPLGAQAGECGPSSAPAARSPLGPAAAPTVGATRPVSQGSWLRASYTCDPTSWALWWSLSGEGYLGLKESLWAAGPETGSEDFFLGRGERNSRAESRRPDDRELQETVVPTLLGLLKHERDDDLQSAALIALAKIGGGREDRSGPHIEQVLASFLRSPSLDVAETAVISLGILGRTNSTFLLADLLGDTPAGRARVGAREEVGYRTRAFAAYGLGLIAQRSTREDLRRFVAGKLFRALETDDTATEDLQVACVVSLGLVPLLPSDEPPASPDGRLHASASREGQLAALVQLFEDPDLDPLVRAHVPVSVARLLRPQLDVTALHTARQEAPWPAASVWKERTVALCARALDPVAKERDEVRAGCTIALGMLGDDDADPSDVELRELLEAEVAAGSQTSRRLALVALGRVAGRCGTGPVGESAVASVRDFLTRRLQRSTTTVRPWAGLGLALCERARVEAGETPAATSLAALRSALRGALAPEEVAGLALAVGLATDLESGPILQQKIDLLREDDARGFAAIALGLLRAREAGPALRELAENGRFRPELLRGAAIGLGLLGDDDIAPELVHMLRDAKAFSSQAAIAGALGQVGDCRSLPALIELVLDTELAASARAFGVVALGIVGDRDFYPPTLAFAQDLNYAATTATLTNSAGTGILDLF